MLSAIEKRNIQKTVVAQSGILLTSISAIEKRKAQKTKLEAMTLLGMETTKNQETTNPRFAHFYNNMIINDYFWLVC